MTNPVLLAKNELGLEQEFLRQIHLNQKNPHVYQKLQHLHFQSLRKARTTQENFQSYTNSCLRERSSSWGKLKALYRLSQKRSLVTRTLQQCWLS